MSCVTSSPTPRWAGSPSRTDAHSLTREFAFMPAASKCLRRLLMRPSRSATSTQHGKAPICVRDGVHLREGGHLCQGERSTEGSPKSPIQVMFVPRSSSLHCESVALQPVVGRPCAVNPFCRSIRLRTHPRIGAASVLSAPLLRGVPDGLPGRWRGLLLSTGLTDSNPEVGTPCRTNSA